MQCLISDIVCPFIISRIPFRTKIGEVYYLLYVDGCGMQSKVAIDPEEPSLGRIPVDFVAPPHNLAAIKACISMVERIPALVDADLFANISCNFPMKEGPISLLGTDCPGLSPKEPMAIVQEDPSIPNGRYGIKNGKNMFLYNGWNSIETVNFKFDARDRVTKSDSNTWKVNEHSNYSSVQRIIHFRSGTSHMTLMVTY